MTSTSCLSGSRRISGFWIGTPAVVLRMSWPRRRRTVRRRTRRCEALYAHNAAANCWARPRASPPPRRSKGLRRRIRRRRWSPNSSKSRCRICAETRSKLGPTPDDESLHRLRIDAKRVRYAAELAAPVVGKRARQAARALAQVQDVLGDHHDATAAALRLRALGPRTGPAGVWAAGLLAGLALARAAEDRDRFQSVWEHAAAPEHWRWAE